MLHFFLPPLQIMKVLNQNWIYESFLEIFQFVFPISIRGLIIYSNYGLTEIFLSYKAVTSKLVHNLWREAWMLYYKL